MKDVIRLLIYIARISGLARALVSGNFNGTCIMLITGIVLFLIDGQDRDGLPDF